MEAKSEGSLLPLEEPKSPSPEQTPSAPGESKGPSPEQTPPPAEEPILLNKLFPAADRDLDKLFPETEMKKLLKDLVRTRQKNDRFLKRIDLDDLPPEEE